MWDLEGQFKGTDKGKGKSTSVSENPYLQSVVAWEQWRAATPIIRRMFFPQASENSISSTYTFIPPASESSIRNNSMSKGTGKTGNQANDEDPYSAFARKMDDLARSESAKGKGKKGKGKTGKIAEEPDDSSD